MLYKGTYQYVTGTLDNSQPLKGLGASEA